MFADKDSQQLYVKKTSLNWLSTVNLEKKFWFGHQGSNSHLQIRTHPSIGDFYVGLDRTDPDKYMYVRSLENQYFWKKV